MDTRQGYWLIAGFALAPLAAALASILVSFLTDTNAGGPINLLVAVLVVYVVSAPVILIVGIPSLALAHRYKLVRWWVAAIVGALSGALFRLIGHFDQLNAAWLKDYGSDLFMFALAGIAPALLVWWCWHSAYAREARRLGT
jgi:hypothetical protein